MNIIYWI